MCNQAAGLSRCLTTVQDAMSTQLKSLQWLNSRASPQKECSKLWQTGVFGYI